VAGISLAEGWAPSTVNNLLRALIAQMAGASQSEGGWLELQTSITAGTTQTMAGAYALTSPLSHVTTCANPSDGVALPANVVETQITIVNGGANDLKIWPNNGASDTINGGSANAADANLLAAGDSRTYMAINGTNWVSQSVSADLTAIADGSVSAPSLANSGDTNTGIYFPAADTVGVVAGGVEQFRFGSNPIPGGSKNLLINGDMRIKQRTTMPTTGTGYTVDRWQFSEAGAMVATITQDTDVPAGKGFANSLKIVVATEDSSVAAGDYAYIVQRIEGQNLQHLEYGHADAKSLTVSFWTKRPLTGVHNVAIYSQDATHRTYVREFTIAVADTWEYFSLTFPGDASGNINDDNGAGIDLIFPLMSGSTWQISADTWSAGQDWATSNSVNDVGIASDIIYLTGVQLEIGDVSTDFAHEDIGTQLRKCQRYFYSTNIFGASTRYGVGAYDATNALGSLAHFPTTMRAVPTAAFDSSVYRSAHDGAVHDSSITIGFTVQADGYMANIGTQSSATQGDWYWIIDNGGDATTGAITFTAEL
jgi:hypothetical protein